MPDEFLNLEETDESPKTETPEKKQFDLKGILLKILRNRVLRTIFIGGVVIFLIAVALTLVMTLSGEKERPLRIQVVPDVKAVLTKVDRDGRQAVVTLRLGVVYEDDAALVEEFRGIGNDIIDRLLPDLKDRSIHDILNYEKRERLFSFIVDVVKQSVPRDKRKFILTVYLDDIKVSRTGR
jgi:hypothetical protein